MNTDKDEDEQEPDEFFVDLPDEEEDEKEKPPAKSGKEEEIHTEEEDDDEEISDEVSEDELRSYSKNVRKRIDRLTRRHHDERRAREAAAAEREEATRFAKSVVEENNRLKKLLNQGEQVLVGEAKGRLASELKTAQSALKVALESGDADAITDAQSELARVMAQRERVESYKPQEFSETVYPERQPRPDHRAEEWRERNRWFGRDEEMTAYAMGLHNRLVNRDGIRTDSDEYYKEIDANIRTRFADRFPQNQQNRQPRTPGRTVVAPARRTSQKSRRIALTETQVRLARRLGLTNEQYAAAYDKENPDG